MAKALDLKINSYKLVTQSTLDNVMEKTYPTAQVLCLTPRENILLDVSVSEDIVSISKIEEWRKATRLFPNLKFKGLQSRGNIQIDLLIGMDFINRIRGTQIIRVGDLEARSSLLGYYLEGSFTHNEESTTLVTKVDADIQPVTPLDLNYKDSPLSLDDLHDERLEERIHDFFSHGDFTEKEDNEPTKEDLLKCLNEGTRKVETKQGEVLYEVPMLWRSNESKKKLKSNFAQVLAFLNSNTRRLRRENMIKTYDDLIQEGIRQGIYEVIPTDPTRGHHIPTFGALNPNSTSTPVRLVLAANLPYGNSINSELHTGPSLIRDLAVVLRQFRTGRVGISGDISKAFHRLVVREEDRDYFRFLWWAPGKVGKEILTLRLARVPFGTNLAPFQFLGTLMFHLSSHPEKEVAESLMDKFYSDNMVTAIDHDPLEYILNAVRVLKHGGFDLRKFSSNCEELNKKLQQEHNLWNDKEPNQTRVLGMIWNFQQDTLAFSPPKSRIGSVTTKREALQTLMSHFDPLGLLSALSMPLTNLFSKFCEKGYTWDEKLSKDDSQVWNELYNELTKASCMVLPRYHELDKSKPVRLCVFADATGVGWGGCCAYLVQHGKAYLVAGKAKLPPKRLRDSCISVPKRELEAMVLGAKMLQKLMETYKGIYELNPHIFSDSTIALNWLCNKAKVNVFVDNRVRLVSRLIGETPLHYIDTLQNPADAISRGMTAKDYLNPDHLLWTGPGIVHDHEIPRFKPESNEAEIGAICVAVSTTRKEEPSVLNLISECPTLEVVKRVISNLIRFTRRWRNQPPLSPNTLAKETARRIIRAEQEKFFHEEIGYLRCKKGRQPPKVRSMQLFLDKHSILRVGGRLAHASIGWAQKYPILLPRDSALLPLRIQEMHETIKHGGPGLTKTALQQLYWIPRVGKLIPKVLSKCYKCRRATGPPLRPPAPPALPPERATLNPMAVIGVDLTGFFSVKGPNNQTEKVYLCFFTCCSSRYINIEMLDNMNTETFLMAFRRHCSRFSIPQRIWSDNATYFVKSASVLGEKLGEEFLTEVAERMHKKGIDWKFNIASAPWQGGHFERLIGVTKSLLKRVCGRKVLQKDEFWTLSKEIQAIVNSRPYGVHPTDARDRQVLTPNLVVFGRPLNPLPYGESAMDEDEEDDPPYIPDESELDKHWRQQAMVIATFRKQFQEEYFSELRKRHIQDHTTDPTQEANIRISKGDLVLIQSDIKKRSLWELAEVLDVIESQLDGKVRAAKLRTKEGNTTRPLQKIFPLLDADELRPNGRPEDTTQETADPLDHGEEDEHKEDTRPKATRPRRKAAVEAAKKFRQQLQNDD